MPTFQYEALDESGQVVKNTVSAPTSDEAVARIRAQGYFPTSVREQKVRRTKKGEGGGGGGGGGGGTAANAGKKKSALDLQIQIGGVSQKHLTTFTRQLSTLQDAGLPVLRSLAILEQQQKPGLLKTTLQGVHDDVAGGTTLSESMSKHPKAFNKLYVKMIAAGEVGGVLDLILQRLSEFMEKAEKLKRKIIGAMIYPAAVVGVAAAIVLGIMILIVPKFIKIFEDFGTELPLLTKFLIGFSKWLNGPLLGKQGNPDQLIPGFVWITAAPFVIYFAMKLARRSKVGQSIIDNTALYVPVLGSLIRKTTVARFSRTLGTLIGAGVPILDAINITRETTGNYVYASALQKVHDSVRQGESFAEPLRQAKVCDSIVVNMIDVGEETGELDSMLNKVADNYDDEVDTAVAGLVSLLEPIMVVLLGGIVGFIVVALFLPMVSLVTDLMG